MRVVVLFGILVLLLATACSVEKAPAELVNVDADPTFIPGPVDSFPMIQYANLESTLNDRCAVRKKKLNTKVPPLYVNGKPVGFC